MKQSRHGEEYTIVDGKHVHGVALRVDTAEQEGFQNVIDDLIDQYRSSVKHMHQNDRHLLRAYVGKCDVQPKGWQNVFSRRDARANEQLQEDGLDASLIETLRTPAKVAMWYGCSEKKAREILRNAIDCFPHIRAQVTTPKGHFFKGEEDFGPSGFLPDAQAAPKLRKEASTNGEESNQQSGQPCNRPVVDDNQEANSAESESHDRAVDVDISGSGAAGLVYILTNAALSPNYLKIGMTTRTSEQRAREISSGTGVVCPIKLLTRNQSETAAPSSECYTRSCLHTVYSQTANSFVYR